LFHISFIFGLVGALHRLELNLGKQKERKRNKEINMNNKHKQTHMNENIKLTNMNKHE